MFRGRSHAAVELWGGIECTVNRVGELFLDQLDQGGHSGRIDDLDIIAELGLRTVRYPVLWERTEPDGPDSCDWSWSDERLGRLRSLEIDPIIGLLHHGSGPRWTSLADDDFPEAFARFAHSAAARYPWVKRWTPVNEPLTTARFSALYGHWYPHARSDSVFARILVNQCRATELAMRAIRNVRSDAELVQTEDLGRTYSTAALADQAEFENQRRWLSLDLITGRVDPSHRMWGWLTSLGITESELERMGRESCDPAIVGLNHYLTSERFLDERLERYPSHTHGGNGSAAYADIEAVRVLDGGVAGHSGMLDDAWERYRLPLAIAEVQLGCTREQQLRWLQEAWSSACGARGRGIDVRAVTVWALFGAYGWRSLVTRLDDHYEPGAFDVRSLRPRATALAAMVSDLASHGRHDHPVLSHEGWWRQPGRLLYPAMRLRKGTRIAEEAFESSVGNAASSNGCLAAGSAHGRHRARARPILITGANGTLGRAFALVCGERQLDFQPSTRADMEISDRASVLRLLDEVEPWAVVNAAGFVRVDDAELECGACYRDNLTGPSVLADLCAERGIALMTFSSDLVFDGAPARPYMESDEPRPLCVYGRSKADSEQVVMERLPEALVIRTSAFFGPWDEHNFVAGALRSIGAAEPFIAAEDQVVSPTYVPDLVHTALDLLLDRERGIWHLANDGEVSWADLARQAAEMAGFDSALVEARPTAALDLRAQRPRYSVLGSERGRLLPSLDDAMSRYFSARGVHAINVGE